MSHLFRRHWFLALAVLGFAGCGGTPSGPTATTTTSVTGSATTSSASTSTTTTTGLVAGHYVGVLNQSPPLPQLPIDVSLFFSVPGGAIVTSAFRPLAIYNVTGGYNTGPNGFTGTINGTLDGAIDNGIFTGVVTANLSGCVAQRTYRGPLTRESLNWAPGEIINDCGGASPLNVSINPPAAPTPVTTSALVTTTSTPATSAPTTSVPTSTTSSSSTTTTITGCLYTLAPALNVSFPSAGGDGTITITTQPGCAWTATTDTPWIRGPNPSSGIGAGSTAYSVQANTGTALRQGGVRINNSLITVTQSGAAAGPSTTTTTAATVLPPPSQVSPANGAVFSIFPRTTTLTWSSVNGASQYGLDIEYCQPPACADGSTAPYTPLTLSTTTYTFNFVGAQPGRWRVWSIGPNGVAGAKSGWWIFYYTI